MTKATNKNAIVATAELGAIKFPKASDFVKAVAETAAPVVETKPVTKADLARVILAESYGMAVVPARKEIIKRLVEEAKLTPAGAATYLQNYKTKNGLTQKALAAVAA
jgi:hypothetical protein